MGALYWVLLIILIIVIAFILIKYGKLDILKLTPSNNPQEKKVDGASENCPCEIIVDSIKDASICNSDAAAIKLRAAKDMIIESLQNKNNSIYEKLYDVDVPDNVIGDTIREIRSKCSKKGKLIRGSADSMVTERIYDLMKVYAKEVGTSKYVEEYLKKVFKLEIPSEGMKKNVKYPKLYRLIDDIVFYHDIESPEEFMKLSRMSYVWFLPKEKRPLVLNAYKYKINIIKDIDDIFEDYLPSRLVSSAAKDELLDKFAASHMYFKLKPQYAKKSIAYIKKQKAKAFSLDIMPILPDVKHLVNILKEFTKGSELDKAIKSLEKSALVKYESDLIKRAIRKMIEKEERYDLYKSLARKNIALKEEEERKERQRIFDEANRQEIEKQKRELERERRQAKEAQEAADEALARNLQEQFDREAREARERARNQAPPLPPLPPLEPVGIPPENWDDDLPPPPPPPEDVENSDNSDSEESIPADIVEWRCRDCGGIHRTAREDENKCPMLLPTVKEY